MRVSVAFLLASAIDGLRHRHHSKKQISNGDSVALDGNASIRNIDAFPHCHLSNSTCSLDSLTETTLVFTDREDSRCWNGDPWAFLVRPGNAKKLFMYFAGGGGCWEGEDGESNERCFDSLDHGVQAFKTGLGIFNFNKSGNKFKDYTMVSLPYCTGGAWVANVSGTDGEGVEVYQYGYRNAELATEWALRNLGEGPLDRFVIAGSSAGAMGISVWSYSLLDSFTYAKASVLLDSYIGVFPDGTQGKVLKSWAACDTPLWQSFGTKIKEACDAGNGNIYDVLEMSIAKYRNVAFTHIQSKGDAVQRAFYTLIAQSYSEKPDLVFSASKLYKRTNDIMNRYNKYGNYVVFFIK